MCTLNRRSRYIFLARDRYAGQVADRGPDGRRRRPWSVVAAGSEARKRRCFTAPGDREVLQDDSNQRDQVPRRDFGYATEGPKLELISWLQGGEAERDNSPLNEAWRR